MKSYIFQCPVHWLDYRYNEEELPCYRHLMQMLDLTLLSTFDADVRSYLVIDI